MVVGDNVAAGMNIVERIWNGMSFLGRKIGDINTVNDTEFSSTIIKKIDSACDLTVVGANFIASADGAHSTQRIWSPIAKHLLRIAMAIPDDVACAHRRDRLWSGGYVLCSDSANGKTYAAEWLMDALRQLDDTRRPRGFMVSGNPNKNESYAQYIARSLKIDATSISEVELAKYIVQVLRSTEKGNRPTIMIMDTFNAMCAGDEDFIRQLYQWFSNYGLCFIILTDDPTTAKTMVKMNGWARIQAFPETCPDPVRVRNPDGTEGRYDIERFVPQWASMYWDKEMLTSMVLAKYPDQDWALNEEGVLVFLQEKDIWNPGEVSRRAKSMNSTPRNS